MILKGVCTDKNFIGRGVKVPTSKGSLIISVEVEQKCKQSVLTTSKASIF